MEIRFEAQRIDHPVHPGMYGFQCVVPLVFMGIGKAEELAETLNNREAELRSVRAERDFANKELDRLLKQADSNREELQRLRAYRDTVEGAL